MLGLPLELVADALQADDTNDAGLHLVLRELCDAIHGVPRHLGIHNGGMVLMGSPLTTRVPTEPATMPGRVVVQWDKEALEDAGLVKIDLLGLRTLSLIAEALEVIRTTTGEPLAIDHLTFDDRAVYAMICVADTIGVFQVKSRAQAQVLPRLQPRCFADLVVAISLIRPGPIQGEMVHPYLRRRTGVELVTYLHPSLEPALRETLGVILFQEQVLKVARDLAGISEGQGERLRRALGGKHGDQELKRLREAFLDGARARGVPDAVAGQVWEQLRAFGGYAFPKSHAATFAVLVYQTAYLKRYHPLPFYTALLNNQPMGFWSPAVIVGDARRHGVRVRGVDIVRSQVRCTVEGATLWLGLNYVRGLGEEGAQRVVAARQEAPFTSLRGLCRRTRLPRILVERLVRVGALDAWSTRRQLLWELRTLRYTEEELDLPVPLDAVDLPPLTRAESVAWEHEVLGLSPGDHAMAVYRSTLTTQGMLGSAGLAACADGTRVRVAGLRVIHQAPPTAKGHHFLTLEDEDGLINVIVRPQLIARDAAALRGGRLLLVEGRVQHSDGVTDVIATRVLPLDLPINEGNALALGVGTADRARSHSS